MIKAWYDKDPVGKSVTIIRPTVVFGERIEECLQPTKADCFWKVFDDWKGSE